MPVTMDFIKKNPSNGNYLMTFPLLGEEQFTVWRSKSETKGISGRQLRDMRKAGYAKSKLPKEATKIKFNIECWAFKAYYTYTLAAIDTERAFLSLSSEYRANYSFVRTFSKILSFIIDGQHDHAAEIAKQYAAHIVKKR